MAVEIESSSVKGFAVIAGVGVLAVLVLAVAVQYVIPKVRAKLNV